MNKLKYFNNFNNKIKPFIQYNRSFCNLLYGTKLASSLKKNIKTDVKRLKTPPGLAILTIGNDVAADRV